jgi:hypothetical protein
MRATVLGWTGVHALVALAVAASPALAQRVLRPERGVDRSRGEDEQIRKRQEWFVRSRGLDRVARPDLLRAEAVRDMAERQRRRADELRLSGETWQPLGPATMTMLSWDMGPVAGRVVALAVDPTDENVLYLGSASGGLWKTVNGGGSWTPVFDEVGTLSIGALALDPADPDVLWAGTGERQSSCASYFGLGLYRSADGGTTFEPRNGSAPFALELSYIVSIAVHPSDPQTVLVSGDGFCLPDGTRAPGGVFKTTDAGTTWRRVLAGTGSDVIYEPGNPLVVYAMMSNLGVRKSVDGGETWSAASTGVVNATRMRLALAPGTPQTLYVLTSGSRLFRTDDGAATWNQVNASACEGQCTYNLTLDVHPTDPNILLVGTIRHALSTNGGATLSILTSGWGSAQKVHQDTHVVRFSRTNGQRFWVGTDGGLWRTDNGGTTYSNLNSNLILTQFYDVAIDPSDPTRVFGGAQDNSSSRRSGLLQWNVTVVTGDGFMNLVDQTDPNRIFQTSYPQGDGASVYRSSSGGSPGSFARLPTTGLVGNEPFPWVTPMANERNMIFVGSHSVYRAVTSQPQGSFTWSKISPNLTGGASLSVITTTAPVPRPWGDDPGTAAYVSAYAGSSNGRIQRTLDALGPAVAWTDVTGNYPGGYVSDLATTSGETPSVLVSRGAFGLSKLYRSAGGGTWVAAGSGLPDVPANAVAVDPLDDSRIFVGTDVGVFESEDGGDTFLPFSLGMPAGAVVTDLEVGASPHVLVAGTYGRGAFVVNLLSGAAGADGLKGARLR